jgi:hypothetical protein
MLGTAAEGLRFRIHLGCVLGTAARLTRRFPLRRDSLALWSLPYTSFEIDNSFESLAQCLPGAMALNHARPPASRPGRPLPIAAAPLLGIQRIKRIELGSVMAHFTASTACRPSGRPRLLAAVSRAPTPAPDACAPPTPSPPSHHSHALRTNPAGPERPFQAPFGGP